jgi:hypothetical protein
VASGGDCFRSQTSGRLSLSLLLLVGLMIFESMESEWPLIHDSASFPWRILSGDASHLTLRAFA